MPRAGLLQTIYSNWAKKTAARKVVKTIGNHSVSSKRRWAKKTLLLRIPGNREKPLATVTFPHLEQQDDSYG